MDPCVDAAGARDGAWSLTPFGVYAGCSWRLVRDHDIVWKLYGSGCRVSSEYHCK